VTAAVLALAAPWAARRFGWLQPGEEELREEVAERYGALWAGLDDAAREAAAALPPPSAEAEYRRQAFRRLGELALPATTLLLVDPDGEAVAWAGEGLLNEPEAGEIVRSGRDFLAAFGSVTLVSVAPLEEAPRPWRLVAGRSFPTDRWPFDPPRVAALSSGGRGVRWSLVRPGTAMAPGATTVELAGAPTLVLLRPERPAGAGRDPWRRPWVRVAGGLLAVLLLLGLAAWWRPRIRRPWVSAAVAAAGGLALTGGAWALLEALGGVGPGPGSAPDLAARVWPGAEPVALRLGLAAAALAVVLLARRRPPAAAEDGAPRFELWAWGGLAALVAAAALHDLPAAALPLLAAGAAALALWAGGRALARPLPAAVLVLGASLLGAAAWETAHRLELKRELGRTYLPAMAPPTPAEVGALDARLQEHFSGLDLAEQVPRIPEGLAREDLAFFLWRRSPLARADAVSALIVEPFAGELSVFAFGPPVALPEGPDWNVVRWEERALPVWEGTLMTGEAFLAYAGEPWAVVRYWLLPRPGFGLEAAEALEPIELGLLRRGPAADRTVRGLPEPALYGLYGEEGRALLSPWPETPPLPAELAPARGGGEAAGGEARRARVETPTGPAWAWGRRGPDGVEVLFLPVLRPGRALERVGTHALGSLLALAAVAGLLVLLALHRPGFRAVAALTFRSYSKRLIVVFTVLLLVPLFLLNLVILADAEERLNREQRAAGEAALDSAQRFIGEFVASLDPGFGFATEVDDELLIWLSRLVHHEVNLYWGSSIWASSKPELFAAGLLPDRIPGEAFSRLTLRGYDLSSRTNLARGIEYLELYAPLRIPGGPAEQERLFLSLPLLAQQEEVARELGSLRRRVILASAALFGLLIAVGAGFARRFSQPLEELVAGTRRIAAGAPSLDLAPPSELELAALVEAVDEMARRIAESRSRLVREKEVVDRMVENITSGVVSLDRERRVLMHNRVAAELLGVLVGEGLDEALARSERLAPVREVLAGAGRELVRTTVRLPAAAGGEGTGEDGGAAGPAGGEGAGGDREWTLVWVPVPGEGEPTALLVVEDATEVLRGQRLEAWAEMARIIAHEIKNPLTPLRLSAEHLQEVYRGLRRGRPAGDGEVLGRGFGEVFERCTTNILRQVEELRQIATEFSAFSSIPRIDPRTGDLVEAMRELVDAYRSAGAAGLEVALESDAAELRARFDPRLLGRAIRNLLENAVRASAGGGEVLVRLGAEDGTATISVLDSGPGVPPELLGRIFDPYFSTHDTGTGLGLPIARRVAEEHGGSISARNRPGGGLEVTIRIPV
jgi:signal transduction histidine kinase